MSGKVTLVGAGPGDSELLTLKGKRALEQADIVYYDRLVGQGILAMIPPSVECVYVGKEAGNHTVPQGDINLLLLKSALEGKQVVRLKGGDPFLFGRGAEELEEVVKQNIPFEVIPGITSAIAVPEYAGIPVTHREHSSSVQIITGYKKKDGAQSLDFESLAKSKGTLVFLMGFATLETVCKGLIEKGMSEETPAALIMNGTTNRQKKLISDLKNIKKQADKNGFSAPCIFLVGEVCKLSETFDFTKHKPLSHVSVLLTRPQHKNSALSVKLRELGCAVTEIPMIATQTVPMPKEITQQLDTYHWVVFTSPTGVEAFIENLGVVKKDIRSLGRCKIAAVGKKTEQTLNKYGLMVDYVPEVFDGAHLVSGLKQKLKPTDKVLLYRSALAAKLLPQELRPVVKQLDDVVAYETNLKEYAKHSSVKEILKTEFDYVLFTSGSAIDSFVTLAQGRELGKVRALCIGEPTAKKANQYGMKTIISERVTIDSMVETLVKLEENKTV